MKAMLLYRFRRTFDDGAILEVVIWNISQPVQGCSHLYKYRLFYGLPVQRVIEYDNERPKGDHRHEDDQEMAYIFSSPEKLIDDFLGDVARKRGQS
jgi:hypothetical protein